MLIRKYIIIIIFLSCSFNVAFAQEEIEEQEFQTDSIDYYYLEDEYFINEKINWNKLFDFFIYSQNKLVNRPMLNFGMGISFPTIPSRIFNTSLPITNFFNLEYGFVRLDSNYRLRNLRAYSSEFVFIEDNTNDFGLINTSDNGIYNNTFSFGTGLRSGYGIKLFEERFRELYGLHSTAFIWSYLDYAGYTDSNFKIFDRQWKFGNKGTATIEYRITELLNIDLEYEHINMYSGMEYGKWLGSWFIDLILQRWIDLLDPIFIENMGYSYPFIKFIYKNAISIIFSEARQLKQFYPFNSAYSILDRRLALKLKLIF